MSVKYVFSSDVFDIYTFVLVVNFGDVVVS